MISDVAGAELGSGPKVEAAYRAACVAVQGQALAACEPHALWVVDTLTPEIRQHNISEKSTLYVPARNQRNTSSARS